MSSPYSQTIQHIKLKLDAVATELEEYFVLPDACMEYHPTAESWSIDEILEHVTLTSTFLLLVIDKSLLIALKRASSQQIVPGESDLKSVEVIGHPDTFPWLRPAHMEPTRALTRDDIRARLQAQFQQCQRILSAMSHGEGSLRSVRMSVQELGKLDIYQWIYFLVLHAQRHSVEIERVRTLWLHSEGSLEARNEPG